MDVLQTIKGGEARRLTMQEFQQRVLKPLVPKWKQEAKEDPDTFQSGIYLVWDNATVHKAGDVFKGTGLKFKVLPVPPRSHDFNKVVEHVLNTLKAAANNYFNDHPEIRDVEEIKKHFERLFFEVIKRSSVRKDIASLRKTYDIVARSVKRGGVAGGWPPKKYRYVADLN